MLGIYIKMMRLKRGMTQKELAQKLYIAPCTLSHYENGLRMTPYSIFELVLDICGFEINVIDCSTKENITKEEVLRFKK